MLDLRFVVFSGLHGSRCNLVAVFNSLYMISGLSVLNAAHEGRILHTTARVGQARNGPVVTEALELVLHGLRKDWALDVRVLGRFGGELGVEVGSIESINLNRVTH